MVVRYISEKAIRHLLITLFILAGSLLMGLRWVYFSEDRYTLEDTAWKVTLSGLFNVKKGVTRVKTARPRLSTHQRLISQRIYHPGFRNIVSPATRADHIQNIATTDGRTELIHEFYILATPDVMQPPVTVELNAQDRLKFLTLSDDVADERKALNQLNEYILRDSSNKEQLIKKIFQQAQQPLESRSIKYDDIQPIITENRATPLGRARLMVALARLNNIPARLVSGFVLQEKNFAKPYYWLEIYTDKQQWEAYDPDKGFSGAIPASYLAFAYDSPDLFTVTDGKKLKAGYSIDEDQDIVQSGSLEQEKDFMDVFDLRRLNFETRDVLIKILILPFCILLTALLRHIVGLFPYGVFTSALLALALIHTNPITTMLIAAIVLALALLGRSVLPKSLSRAPRLSLIFTFVAISMVFSISLLSYFEIESDSNIILLPIIILAAIVDRFYSYMDSSGWHAALLRLGVTVFIAMLCIPILLFAPLGDFILHYPEAHLITAALVLVLSKYRGKKLTDNKYLALLGENKPVKSKKKVEEVD